jgi:hypothetical protein
VLEGSVERFRNKAKGIKEVAFPGPVLSQKKSQRAECYRTFLDALVIIKNYPLQKYRVNHKRLQSWISQHCVVIRISHLISAFLLAENPVQLNKYITVIAQSSSTDQVSHVPNKIPISRIFCLNLENGN